MHSVTKSNRKNNKNKDLKTSKNEYFDPDSLKENKDAEDYLKGLAALTTVFGVGAAGLAFTPTKVHAAESTVDVKSQVVGSVSQAKDINSAASNTEAKESDKESLKSDSTSDARSEANSNSDVRSESNSTSENTSTKGSTSESGSAKGSTSESNSTINSNSNSTKKSTSLTSNSENHSENTSMSGSNASQSAIKSNLNSNLNSNLESNLKSDNGSEITSYINSSSGSLANSLSEATAALDVTAFNQAAIARAAFGTSLRVNSSVDQGTNVTTWDEFADAIKNRDKVININSNLDLEGYLYIDYDVTINANGYHLYANDNIVSIANYNSSSADLNVTVENAKIYGTSTGTFSLYGNANANLTLDNIQFTGGTLVAMDSTDGLQHKFNLTFTGVNTVTAGEYTDTVTNTKQTPSYLNGDGATTQLYADSGVKVADNASLTMNANGSVDYNIMEKGAKYNHSFIVGKNATVKLYGAKVGNVIQDQYYATDAWNNIVNFGEGAKVTMTAPTVNVLMNNGGGAPDSDQDNFSHNSTFTIKPSATVNLTTKNGSSNGQGNIVITGNSRYLYYSGNGTVTSGDTSLNHTATINIDQDANVKMSAAENSSNIISNAKTTTVNIYDPDSVVLMNHGGQAYTTIGNGSINVSTTNAKVTTTNINNNSISSSVLDSNVTKYQSDHKVDPGDTTPANKKVLDSIANSNITNVTYIGKTKIEASESASTSAEVINSQSNSIAQSLSEANSINASMNSHNSALTSHSDSVLNSESENQSISTSLATSENASASLKNSENNSALTSKSIAESENASTNSNNSIQNSQNESALNSRSAVQSVAGSQSTSAANSALNSRSVAESTAASENASANTSANKSTSLADSVNASVKTSELKSTSAAQSVAGSQSTSAANSALNSRSVAESTAASENASANQSESVVQSTNASITDSENASTSLQNSEAASANKSTSIANSETTSSSLANSINNSENMSQSLADSAKESENLSDSLQNSVGRSRNTSLSIAASENTSANASESVNDSGLQSQSIVDSGNQSISGSTSITSEGSLSGSTSVADSVDKLLPALDIVLTHNAYIYQNDGITTLKENGKNIVLKFGKTIHAMNNGQIFTFNGKKFYRIGDNQYVKVSNTISYYYLVHNSFLYNKHGKTIKRNGKRILVRKGVRLEANKVKVVKINGKKFYKVGKSTYIKFRNAKLIISPNN